MRLLVKSNGESGTSTNTDEFVCGAVISSCDLDSDFSFFDKTSLENFVSDINGERNIPLLDSHETMKMESILGRWEEAKLDGDAVHAQLRMLRDTESTPSHLKVDEYIRRIEAGYFNEVSVGYSGGKDECNICGLDMWSRSEDGELCQHWPGKTYDGKLCTYTIKGAGLREVSLVTRGANPAAQISNREEDPRYGWKNEGGSAKSGETSEKSMLEKDGERFREALLSTLCEEGVRALGNKFDEKVWRERLALLDSTAIEDQIAIFKQASEPLFPRGRQSSSSTAKEAGEKTAVTFPSWVFN